MKVRERVKYIEKKHSSGADGFTVVVFDLYDIMMGILEKKGYLENAMSLSRKRAWSGSQEP